MKTLRESEEQDLEKEGQRGSTGTSEMLPEDSEEAIQKKQRIMMMRAQEESPPEEGDRRVSELIRSADTITLEFNVL